MNRRNKSFVEIEILIIIKKINQLNYKYKCKTVSTWRLRAINELKCEHGKYEILNFLFISISSFTKINFSVNTITTMNKNKYYVKVVKYTALHLDRIMPDGLFSTDHIYSKPSNSRATNVWSMCVAICNLICCLDLTGVIKYQNVFS